MLEWKEREHENDDLATLHDPQAGKLSGTGLLKYFKIQNMRKEILLLEHLIGLWDVDEQAFQVGSHMLEIDIEDVYFLMGLSRRGEPIILSSHRTMPQQTYEYIAQFCVPGSHKESGRIVIKDVRDLPLRAIMFTITKLEGSTSPHLASKSQMAYVVQCLEPRIFNWCADFWKM
jgi:hypothetical protein